MTVPKSASAQATVALAPATVTGGSSSTGTITIATPAGVGGASVTLSSSNINVATAPSPVVIAAGQTTATFTVSTTPVAAQTTATISAVYNAMTRTALLTVIPPALNRFSISPGTVSQGGTVTGSLGIDGPAPVGGATVTISCSKNQAALFASTATILQGLTAADFSIASSTVNYPITVTFTAAAGGATLTAPLDDHARQSLRHEHSCAV